MSAVALTGKVGQVQHRRDEHRDARRSGVEDAARPISRSSRVKRDILRRSSVGVMLTNRSQSTVVPGASNLAYGVDGAFSFFQNVNFGGYWARSRHRGRTTTTTATRGDSTTPRDRYGAQARLPEGRRQLQSRSRLRRGATTSGDRTGRRGSARVRRGSKSVRKFTYGGHGRVPRERSGPAGDRAAGRAFHRRSSRTATCSPSR